jgi:hypothetical protein
MVANHKQTNFIECSPLFQPIKTTNICKIGLKYFANFYYRFQQTNHECNNRKLRSFGTFEREGVEANENPISL